ncbi:MAG TPA: chorismate synthase, partial [Firmicutes bacterium]|nr:chorismate synthase [Bacillota bacterium]
MSLRYLSGGESHGPCLTGVIDGLPANLEIDIGFINNQLSRRQQGYGRGGRMAIEKDEAVFLGGLRFSRTTGAPVVVQIMNKDYEAWKEQMQPLEPPPEGLFAVTAPRPGHADLPGALKYNQEDLRNILERASARETTMRVAAGSIARLLLKEFGVAITSLVISIGPVKAGKVAGTALELQAKADSSPLRCADRRA